MKLAKILIVVLLLVSAMSVLTILRLYSGKEEGSAEKKARFMESFYEALGNIPPKERSYGKINDLIYKQLLSPAKAGGDWFFDDDVRADIAHIEDEADRIEKYEKNIPSTLEGFDNVKFNSRDKTYYIERGTRKLTYDQYGTFLSEDELPRTVSK